MSRMELLLTWLIGLILISTGSVVWLSRLSFSPEIGVDLYSIPKDRMTDVDQSCRRAVQGDGWVLFALEARLKSDNKIRSYFETAEQPEGLRVEYVPGSLMLQLGHNDVDDESRTISVIRTVRREEHANIFVGVTRDEVRIVTNAVDKRVSLTVDEVSSVRCDAVRIADDTRALPSGNLCNECDVSLRVATGVDSRFLQTALDDISNRSAFNLRRWLGTALILAGALNLIFTPSVVSRRRSISPRTSSGS